jgi:Cro/C1-type helix-turn-helix DNA-binding protein
MGSGLAWRNYFSKSVLQCSVKYHVAILMTQVALLVDTLKKSLRKHALTYADVASTLRLSESSVKRLFARRDLSLDRVERICRLMKLDITDLLELMHAAEPRIEQLSEEQERSLVNEPKLLLVGILAISYWTAADMLETFRFTKAELVRLLVRLDRMRIIDLLPEDQIKVRLARNFTWRKDGPIQRFFEERIQQQFFTTSFTHHGEQRIVVFGALSRRSNELMQQRVQKIAQEFDALVEEDRALDHRMRTGTTMVLAIRPWEPTQFTELRRRGSRDILAKAEREWSKA